MQKFCFTFLLLSFCLLIETKVYAVNFYADPSSLGSMNNSGSFQSPWSSLASVFASNKSFQSGDTIFLRTGNHGYVSINGINNGFVVITPEPGHFPIISRVSVSNAAFWKLYNLTVQSESSGALLKGDYPLVELFGTASNITVSACTIQSASSTENWTRDDWRTRCNWGISTRDRLNSNFVIEDNTIKNVAFGLSISSSNCIVRRNTVQYFTNDGSRVLGSDILFEKNKIMDLIKVMTVAENHDDLFQSFVYLAGGPGQQVLRNNIIRANLFMATSDTNRPFTGSIQGMGCFDGPFENWIVENNIIITDNWHGISFYQASNCKIVNNTVIDPYEVTPIDPYDLNKQAIGPAWIYLDGFSSDNIVSNNISNTLNISSGFNTIASNNYTIGKSTNYTKLFANYFANVSDLTRPGLYYLHPKSGSVLVDNGDNMYAPAVDYDEIERPKGTKVDVGAYEYNPILSTNNLNPENRKICIYPNPFQKELYLDWNSGNTHSVIIEVLNLNGQQLSKSKLQLVSSVVQLEDLYNFKSGTYILKLTGDNGFSHFEKICKLN